MKEEEDLNCHLSCRSECCPPSAGCKCTRDRRCGLKSGKHLICIKHKWSTYIFDLHIWLSKDATRVVIQFPYCDCDCCAMFKWLLRKSADGRWWRGFDRISFAIALTRAREGLEARNDPETVTSNKILQHSDPMQKNWAQKDTWSQSGGSPDLFFKDIVGSAVQHSAWYLMESWIKLEFEGNQP